MIVFRITHDNAFINVTMDINVPFTRYRFMVKMLYFLSKKYQKMIRCNGIYAHGEGEKLQKNTNATWKAAIEHSFDADPEQCPDAGQDVPMPTLHTRCRKASACGAEMIPSVVYGYNAEKVWFRMRREYHLYKGYFRTMKRGP